MLVTLPPRSVVKNWSEILEHQRVRDVLRRAVSSGKLHHAYLFTGPTGVGKFTVANALAAVLNCERRDAEEFAPNCGECSSCRRIASRQHPDFLVVEPPARIITIDQIRAIEKAASSAPYEGRFRVVIIDDAHTMRAEGANALLKTLEEPPDRMIIVVVTDQPHLLLDTIISRCQRVRFGPLDDAVIADALKEWGESDDVDDALLTIAAGYAEGSLGRALAVLETGMLSQRRQVLDALFALDEQSPRAWLDLAEEFSDSTEQLEQRIDILTVFLRDMMLTKRADHRRVINTDLRDLLDDQARRFSLEAILHSLDALMVARQRLARNVTATLVAEQLLDRLRSPHRRALEPPPRFR